jgi:hypothetical protein
VSCLAASTRTRKRRSSDSSTLPQARKTLHHPSRIAASLRLTGFHAGKSAVASCSGRSTFEFSGVHSGKSAVCRAKRRLVWGFPRRSPLAAARRSAPARDWPSLLDADDAQYQRLRALPESAAAAGHGGRGVASSNFVAWRTGLATG